MNSRRGFLALIGGAGAVTGSILFRKAVAVPTLILLPGLATPGVEQPISAQPTEPEMQAVLDVKAGLSHAMFVDWLESGLRLVEDCKPGGGVFGAYWRQAKRGEIPPPPKRIVGRGDRTEHEQAYLMQSLDALRGSPDRVVRGAADPAGRRGMNHRNLLTAAVASVMLPGAVGAEAITMTVIPSPDADLLEACAAFDALERAYVAAGSGRGLPGTPEDEVADAEQERITAEQEPLVERMCELRAVSREGHAARARSLALWDAELMKPGKAYTGDRLTAAIVRDLLA